MTRNLLSSLILLALGLLMGAVIVLTARQPAGDSIRLRPAPTPAPLVVHVSGRVQAPGVYPLPAGSRVGDALTAAGGSLPDADRSSLNLAARLEDGQHLSVRALNGDPPPAAGSGAENELSESPVNINTASQAELEGLPGIGPSTAAKIIAYREANGRFPDIESIMEVSGIGPSTFGRISGEIAVDD